MQLNLQREASGYMSLYFRSQGNNLIFNNDNWSTLLFGNEAVFQTFFQ